jgi:hypothetical protein
MENIFFLILVAVVALLRWVSQAAERKRNAEAEKQSGSSPAQETAVPAPRGAPQTEEERIRKFLEALGVPASAPPPKMQPRQTTPKAAPFGRTIRPIDPFPSPRGRGGEIPSPVPSAPPPLPAVAASTPAVAPLPTLETTMLRQTPTRSRTAPEFEVQDVGSGSVSGKLVPATLAAQLTTRSGLRDVVVLREIFGPPRSMQALDL